VSCNRIVLMRLIVHAAMLIIHGCFSYAPHMRRICAAVARMNTCGGVWIAGVTQHSMKDLEGSRPPPWCLEDTLTISMRIMRPHTQQHLCSMTSLRAGAAGRPATWLTHSSRRSRGPTAKSTHMNCSISRVRGPLAHRHTLPAPWEHDQSQRISIFITLGRVVQRPASSVAKKNRLTVLADEAISDCMARLHLSLALRPFWGILQVEADRSQSARR